MRDSANDRLTRLVDAAFSSEEADVLPQDRAKFAQFKKLAETLNLGFHEPPHEVLQQVLSIVPKMVKRRLSLQVLGSTHGLVGVRLENASETQVVWDAEGRKLRIMYGRTNLGWTILGRIEEPGWTAECGGQSQHCSDEGRFYFEVGQEAQTAVILVADNMEIHVPRFEEVFDDGSGMDQSR